MKECVRHFISSKNIWHYLSLSMQIGLQKLFREVTRSAVCEVQKVKYFHNSELHARHQSSRADICNCWDCQHPSGWTKGKRTLSVMEFLYTVPLVLHRCMTLEQIWQCNTVGCKITVTSKHESIFCNLWMFFEFSSSWYCIVFYLVRNVFWVLSEPTYLLPQQYGYFTIICWCHIVTTLRY